MSGTAKQFWRQSVTYPEYGTIKERRLYELNYLVPKLRGDSLLDLGCGDGALLACLMQLTQFKRFFGFDLSPNLLKLVPSGVETRVYDCYEREPLPDTDATIIAGVFPFLFEDEVVESTLSLVRSPVVFVRVPCTLKPADEYVHTFSEQLQQPYESLYRTLPHVLELIGRHFTIQAVDRIYPDAIESRFGTKQFYIMGTKEPPAAA